MSINNWLKAITVPSIARNIRANKDLTDAVFLHLTGKQIKDAVAAVSKYLFPKLERQFKIEILE